MDRRRRSSVPDVYAPAFAPEWGRQAERFVTQMISSGADVVLVLPPPMISARLQIVTTASGPSTRRWPPVTLSVTLVDATTAVGGPDGEWVATRPTASGGSAPVRRRRHRPPRSPRPGPGGPRGPVRDRPGPPLRSVDGVRLSGMELTGESIDLYVRHAFAGMARVLDRLDDDTVNQRPGDWGTNSVAGLVVHCCELAPSWFAMPGLGRDSDRDRQAEFAARATVDALRKRIDDAAGRTCALVAEFQVGPTVADHPFRDFMPGTRPHGRRLGAPRPRGAVPAPRSHGGHRRRPDPDDLKHEL